MPRDSRSPCSVLRLLALLAAATTTATFARLFEAVARLVDLLLGVGDASFFGEVIASGDINGDGRAEVAISGRIDSGSGDRGQVRILRGQAPHGIGLDTLLIGPPNDRTGAALAFGDFDGDGDDEL